MLLENDHNCRAAKLWLLLAADLKTGRVWSENNALIEHAQPVKNNKQAGSIFSLHSASSIHRSWQQAQAELT